MQLTLPHFSPEEIMNSGQCFRMHKTAEGAYVMQSLNRVLIMTPLGEQRFHLSCTKASYESYWRRYLDADGPYQEACRALPPHDLYLRQAAEAGRGIRILHQDPWEMLITFILSQRKTIPAIRLCVEKLCQAAGKPLAAKGANLPAPLYGFPSPKALCGLTLEDIRATGAGYRAPYLLSTAKMAAAGEPLQAWSSLPDEELQCRLMAFPGVGVKVARCVMLFGYHRLHICPVDVWMERVIQSVYGGRDPFPGYGPYGGIYQQYMFYHAQHLKGLPSP